MHLHHTDGQPTAEIEITSGVVPLPTPDATSKAEGKRPISVFEVEAAKEPSIAGQ